MTQLTSVRLNFLSSSVRAGGLCLFSSGFNRRDISESPAIFFI
ncbi:MAG: hypothetical protein ACBR12_18730 [Microcoleus sp.]